MYRCKKCGTNIDEIQFNKYNSLCPECIRSGEVSHTLQRISKSQKNEDLVGYGLMMGVGTIGTIICSVLSFSQPELLLVAFLCIIVAVVGYVQFNNTRKM